MMSSTLEHSPNREFYLSFLYVKNSIGRVALTSVAIATAYRPYWARSTSATFNNFGTTIGSDAGINVLHEFGPGIRQMVKAHTPKFVSRIEEHITGDQFPRDVEARIPTGR